MGQGAFYALPGRNSILSISVIEAKVAFIRLQTHFSQKSEGKLQLNFIRSNGLNETTFI